MKFDMHVFMWVQGALKCVKERFEHLEEALSRIAAYEKQHIEYEVIKVHDRLNGGVVHVHHKHKQNNDFNYG